MACFAKLADDGKTVVNVLAFDKAKATKNNTINEEVGQGHLYRTHGWPAELWRLSEVDKGVPYRKNLAGIGYTYDSTRDAFIAPQNYPSWTLNETTCRWEAPIPRPDADKLYQWDEPNQVWIELEQEQVS